MATKVITGYKATDKNMKCRGYQYELGKWHECEGELKLCKNGFHFCEYPSGPWCFYNDEGTRIWEVEAEDVLDAPRDPGADFKRVARRIRFIKEITIGGDQNTGDQNTGNQNTGHWNTGDRNTGHWSTGDYNTGHYNTGHYNTGDYSTGNWNTGDRNTGDQNTGGYNTGDQNTGHYNTGDYNTGGQNTGRGNTGHWNTGDQNTGDRNTGNQNTGEYNTGGYNTGNQNTGHYNTGDYNTGNQNTGRGNATNFSAGFFCSVEPNVVCFDENTGLSRSEFDEKFGKISRSLGCDLMSDEKILFKDYSELPGITAEKLENLHKEFINARKGIKGEGV